MKRIILNLVNMRDRNTIECPYCYGDGFILGAYDQPHVCTICYGNGELSLDTRIGQRAVEIYQNEKQQRKLFYRYGTKHPESIRDWWLDS